MSEDEGAGGREGAGTVQHASGKPQVRRSTHLSAVFYTHTHTHTVGTVMLTHF